jgi:hypothetical protein
MEPKSTMEQRPMLPSCLYSPPAAQINQFRHKKRFSEAVNKVHRISEMEDSERKF